MGKTISLSLLAACILCVVLFWRLSKSNWIRSRFFKREGKQRQSDLSKLNRHQRKILQNARALHASGKIEASAHLLESIGLTRQAVQTLEEHNHIGEAAAILLRIQRPNRAGFLYARHKRWKEALRCFQQADMPLESAKCAWELGDYKVAAQNFLRANRLAQAAECLVECGDLSQAAKTYTALGDVSKAIDIYRQIVSKSSDVSSLTFDNNEIALIVNYLSQGNVDTPLADLLATQDRLGDVVLALVNKSLTKAASELYQRSPQDLGPGLMSKINYLDATAKSLAEVFMNVSNFQYAGMVLQNMNEFERAADCFVKADDLERAAYCFDRASNTKMVTEMRIRLAGRGAPSANKPVANNANLPDYADDKDAVTLDPFALGNVEKDPTAFDTGPSESEHTALLDAMPTSDPDQDIFRGMAFLIDLSQSEKDELWDIGKTVSFEAGETVLGHKQSPQGLYFIMFGVVATHLLSSAPANASSPAYKILQAPASFCELFALAGVTPTVSFHAQKAVRIRLIPVEALQQALQDQPGIAAKLYKRLTIQLAREVLSAQNNSTLMIAS